MLIRKAYRFKLRVNHPDAAAKLHQFSGCTRFVWNKMLAMNLYRLEHKQALLWYPEMAFWLTLWKSRVTNTLFCGIAMLKCCSKA